jgi:hypothetical protein
MPVWSFGEPVADQQRCVARRVIHPDMHVEDYRDVVLQLVEKLRNSCVGCRGIHLPITLPAFESVLAVTAAIRPANSVVVP